MEAAEGEAPEIIVGIGREYSGRIKVQVVSIGVIGKISRTRPCVGVEASGAKHTEAIIKNTRVATAGEPQRRKGNTFQNDQLIAL